MKPRSVRFKVSWGQYRAGSAYMIPAHVAQKMCKPNGPAKFADDPLANLTVEQVEKLSYRHLQQVCKASGLNATGSAEELRERILEKLSG